MISTKVPLIRNCTVLKEGKAGEIGFYLRYLSLEIESWLSKFLSAFSPRPFHLLLYAKSLGTRLILGFQNRIIIFFEGTMSDSPLLKNQQLIINPCIQTEGIPKYMYAVTTSPLPTSSVGKLLTDFISNNSFTVGRVPKLEWCLPALELYLHPGTLWNLSYL
jgi:hypothetical protein